MIKIYGNNRSRTTRCIWMLEELGIDFERDLIDHSAGENKLPAFLGLNPSGKVPLLQDGELNLSESLAINLYLARKYDNGIWPVTDIGRAKAEQWSFWAASEVEPHTVGALIEQRRYSNEKKTPERTAEQREILESRLNLLDDYFSAENTYLVEDRFTVADLNVAAVISSIKLTRLLDFTTFPKFSKWFDLCTDRKAFKNSRN